MAENTDKSSERHTFRKTERLCSRKEIERLFAGGTAISVFPLKLMMIRRGHLTDVPVKTMFVVPKRNFRKAHDRNLLKRRMRESFRLQKSLLYNDMLKKNHCISMALLYTGKSEESFDTIMKAMKDLLEKVVSRT